MVDFGAWRMPVQYPAGILAEHRAVRTSVGIFDVSHMGEVDFRGSGALEAVQRLVTNDAGKLADGQALYTGVCYEHGGMVDDCIVYRFAPEHLRIVVNAANIEKDYGFFRDNASGCEIVNLSNDFALIAVQGPEAAALVARLGGAHLTDVPRFSLGQGECAGVKWWAARTGYTGEDGFELFVEAPDARKVWDVFIAEGVQPVGLGARDTLRLEARLCLYGNDIDETTTPYEAGLGWVVKLDKGTDFVGRDALVKQKEQGVTRRLIGFQVEGRGIVRPGAEILGSGGEPVGKVTSGSVAPFVGGAIGMGYVPKGTVKPGSQIDILQRGKNLTARVVKGPFYKPAA
jgi:aminomethyltransferase